MAARVQSLDRGIQILLAIGDAGRGMTLAELKQVLGVDRSNAYRLANTLRMRGLLQQCTDTRTYSLGPAVWYLANRMRECTPLLGAAKQYILSLAEKTGESAHLAVRERDHIVFLDYALSNQSLGVSMGAGRVEPVHCTALGKALCADLELTDVQQLFGERELESYTSKTITTIEEFYHACHQVKQKGYAIDDIEYQEGVRCIASPVRDFQGHIVAALGISAPASRLGKQQCSDVAAEVQSSALALSTTLGFVSNSTARGQ